MPHFTIAMAILFVIFAIFHRRPLYFIRHLITPLPPILVHSLYSGNQFYWFIGTIVISLSSFIF